MDNFFEQNRGSILCELIVSSLLMIIFFTSISHQIQALKKLLEITKQSAQISSCLNTIYLLARTPLTDEKKVDDINTNWPVLTQCQKHIEIAECKKSSSLENVLKCKIINKNSLIPPKEISFSINKNY